MHSAEPMTCWTSARLTIGTVAAGWQEVSGEWRLAAISLPPARHRHVVDHPRAVELLDLLADPQQRSGVAWALAARDQADISPFAAAVLDALATAVPAGQVISYGTLASLAGHPGAARAVGTVLRDNRWPLLIPCHRVVAADGRLGAFQGGCPGSAARKRRLLAEEGVELIGQRVRLPPR